MIRLGPGTATVVGVLEPSVPYPADTEIIANVVTSPHHLGALMTTNRSHRMTELFGRLAPDATIESVRAELNTVHAAIVREHPESYSGQGNFQLQVTKLRDQIAAPARTVLLVLLAAAGIVFVIACSNVANLILARSVRREGELAVRAALGAGHSALRRTLLAESLLLCGAGAVLGVLLARPFVSLVAQFAARFSVRAIGVSVDTSVLWIGAGLAMAAAVLLAYVPRLPSPHAPAGLGSLEWKRRITPGTNRRLRIFATTQIAFSFVLLAGAGMLLATLVAMQATTTGYNMRQVLAFDVPMPATGVAGSAALDFSQEAARRIGRLPGVENIADGMVVPWRDAGKGPSFQFTVEGYTRADGEDNPHAGLRPISPRFFAVLGVPLVAGRDFTDEDRAGTEPVSIISQNIAQRLFPNGEALNRHVWWTDPLFGKPQPRRIVGVVADVDDEHVVPGPTMTIYQPLRQMGMGTGGRLFVRTAGDPYALVTPVTRLIRELSPDQPVERPATLEDVRAEVLSPERLNAFVFSGFAGIALLIAVVGVAGVLAFSVSARTREFGVRLAIGSAPRQLLARVLSEGAVIAAIGIAVGAAGGLVLARVAARFLADVRLPGFAPSDRCCGGPDRGGDRRVPDAGRARVARGRRAGPAVGVDTSVFLTCTGGRRHYAPCRNPLAGRGPRVARATSAGASCSPAPAPAPRRFLFEQRGVQAQAPAHSAGQDRRLLSYDRRDRRCRSERRGARGRRRQDRGDRPHRRRSSGRIRNAEVYDGRGKALFPGLINCHAHLAADARARLQRGLRIPQLRAPGRPARQPPSR